MTDVKTRLLPYNSDLRRRDLADIELVVIHATELPDLTMARDYGKRVQYPESGTGNCGHFYIDRDGRIEQWVELDRVAHHVADHNDSTIGIELVNLGRYPDWLDSSHQHWQEDMTDAQIDALVRLLQSLKAELPNLTRIAGHDQLDTRLVPASDDDAKSVRRKLDPGPDFPWTKVLQASGLRPEKVKGER
ncbi:MAG: N-acetylmuramoyl-L-alanine amidase [Wenzhouxiangella sp.]